MFTKFGPELYINLENVDVIGISTKHNEETVNVLSKSGEILEFTNIYTNVSDFMEIFLFNIDFRQIASVSESDDETDMLVYIRPEIITSVYLDPSGEVILQVGNEELTVPGNIEDIMNVLNENW